MPVIHNRIHPLRHRSIGHFLLLTVMILLLGSLAASAEPATQEAAPVTPPQPLAGRASYAENCAPCHGATGLGDGPSAAGLGIPPTALGRYEAIAGRTWQELFEITKNGNMARMMPPWKNRLTDQEIWDTVAYAWTLHTSAQELSLGQQVYEANCATCHGADGEGMVPAAPDLSDFTLTSSVSQATWAASVANGKGTMPGFAGKLTEAEQRAALVYVRSLSLAGPLFRGPLQKGAGLIMGTVTNGTTGQPVADVTVELGIFDHTELAEQRTTSTDAAGRFSFSELPTDPQVIYAARVVYPAGVPYSSDFVSFDAGQTELSLPVTVYETTSDPAGVRAERVHFIVEFDPALPGEALVAELIVFSLDGDRTYVGDGNAVLRFPLPAGATDLGINEEEIGGRFEATADGFVDRLPLRPGSNVRQVLYRYSLPYSGNRLDFRRALPYPATAINALIADVGQQVSSPQLADQGRRSAQGASYYNLVATNLAAGQEILIRMTGLPSAQGGGGSGSGATALSRAVVFLLIGLAAGMAALLVALPILRRRMAPAPAARTGLDREALLDALAGLEAAYEAGEISEAAYRDQRLLLKAQLRDLLRREGAA